MTADGNHARVDAFVSLGVIAACRSFFDRSVVRHETASVAAYSLGDPEILATATREVVDLLQRWDLLGADRRTLEIGCGIGRMQAALAPRVAEAHGIEPAIGQAVLKTYMAALALVSETGDVTEVIRPMEIAAGIELRKARAQNSIGGT